MMSIPSVTSISLTGMPTAGPDRAAVAAPAPVVRAAPADDALVTDPQLGPKGPTSWGEQRDEVREAPPSAEAALEELRTLASDSQLQVKFLKLPDGEQPIYRLVKPETGEVVREFPPEHLTQILASLRAHSRVDARA